MQQKKQTLAARRPFHPSHFLNRELSWLEFNQRVLDEATDPKNPLLERLKFFCIVSSNLDEFFEIRIAGSGARFSCRRHSCLLYRRLSSRLAARRHTRSGYSITPELRPPAG